MVADGAYYKDSRGEWRIKIDLRLTETECLDMAAKYTYDDLFAVELREYAESLAKLAEVPADADFPDSFRISSF